MKNKNKIDELKMEYDNIPIPERLKYVVNDAIESKKTYKQNQKKLLITAASLFLIIGAVNISPVFAENLEQIPVIGSVVKIINFSNYEIKENGYEASIKVPNINGLDNKELEYKLNKEFETQGKQMYSQYLEEIKSLKEVGKIGNKEVKSWYEIQTDNDDILSLVIYNYSAEGSSDTKRKFYNIDKHNQTILTLQSIFKNDDYIKVISENIKQQMKDQMKKDENKYYWLDEEIDPEINFKSIKKDQQFYINENKELVISFDKYEVGPGSMGVVEFVIPNEVINPLMN
ncbi:anti-sigma-V factor rsiV [Paeniclostridium hominis]|uniref:anti-sigma-V factor rsiV n=1 Tax=Paeniclostridium hominis TaxID=2764329 RepID=UPI0022E584F7|nr:anti-sigma-V factor rsiV [Paeniclostridium hominis]